MIDLAQFDYEPQEYEIKSDPKEVIDSIDIIVRFNIREIAYADWWANQITVTIPVVEDIESYVQGHKEEWIEAERYAEAAEEVRKKRDELLKESDKYMMIDRLDLTSGGSSFLAFFQKLKDITSGKYARYRQALRDIPQQKDFPYGIVWPVDPEEEQKGEGE